MNKDFLYTLLDNMSVSGNEIELQKKVIEEMKPFCDEIRTLTFDNLIYLGYPEKAFVQDDNGKTASVCFASQEDVERKADGEYRLYFQ